MFRWGKRPTAALADLALSFGLVATPLVRAAAGTRTVWLAYSDRSGHADWTT